MKQADGLGPNGEKLWVHVSCSLWIPEVGLPWLLVELELSFLGPAVPIGWLGFRAWCCVAKLLLFYLSIESPMNLATAVVSLGCTHDGWTHRCGW